MSTSNKAGAITANAKQVNVGEVVRQAGVLLQSQQAKAAEVLLRKGLAHAPEDADVLRLLSVALRMQDRHTEALPLIKQAAAARPDDALIQNSLGTALDAEGETDAAHTALRRACELAPQAPQVWNNLGKFLGDHARFEEAVPVLQRALALHFHDASQLRLAHALRVLGRTDDSAQAYRELLRRNPMDGYAWIGLAGLKTRRFSVADLDAMQSALQSNALPDDDRISMLFALAKAFDDHKRYAEAFEQYRHGNRLVRNIRPWQRASFSALVERTLAAFDQATAHAEPQLGQGIIFIVGMPRSGSSLIEQVLASHPEVIGGGELGALSEVIQSESKRRHVEFPAWVANADAADWQRMGEQYLQRTDHLRQAGKYFTDKMPGNWLRVGAALAMLPGARVIECRRDPLETCLSCFRTLFMAGAQEFSYDLADLAAYWHDCTRASQYWRETYPRRVHVQRYEALVAEPDTEMRALLGFCGLPFDAACERFYETPRAVATASASQVREPLMRNTARSDHYADALDDLRAMLTPPSARP